MRIYFDSNVFRKIKKDSKGFDPALNDVVESLRPAFIFLFSDAHLADLSSSEPTYRDIDLEHMEGYVQKNFLSFDHVNKELHIYLANPVEAYNSMDFDTFNKVLKDPVAYLEDFFDAPELMMFKPLIRSVFESPLLVNVKDNQALQSLIGAKASDALQDISTIKDALAGIGPISDLLNSKKEFLKYQNLIREFVCREEYSFDAWSFDFDERMRDTAFGKTFTEIVEIINTGADKKDIFNRFINFYSQLEYLGVTEERAGGKRKKNSYMDIYRDASHSYFASNADYFVSDDRGVLVKAFIAYRMDITEMLTPVTGILTP